MGLNQVLFVNSYLSKDNVTKWKKKIKQCQGHYKELREMLNTREAKKVFATIV